MWIEVADVCREVSVDFNHGKVGGSLIEHRSQRAVSWANFKDRIRRFWRNCLDDFVDDITVMQKILTETFSCLHG